MSIANTPFLIAILTSIATWIKTAWDIAGKQISRAAFYFLTIIPMVIKWFTLYRVFLVAVVLVCATAWISVFRTIARLADHAFNVSDNFSLLFSEIGWMGYIVWDGPLNLSYAFGLIPDILGFWASLLSARWLVKSVKWIKFLTQLKIAFR